MKHYTVTIANLLEDTSREVVVDGNDVYLAHKHAIMRECDLSGTKINRNIKNTLYCSDRPG